MNTIIPASDLPGISAASIPIAVGEVIVSAVIVCSVLILAAWLVFEKGPLALVEARPRRNRIPLYLPFVLLAAWAGLSLAATLLITHLLPGTRVVEDEPAVYIALTVVEIVMIVGMIALGVHFFPRGLKGFGLDVRNIPDDLPAAFVNLVAVMPLVWLGVFVVDFLGKQFVGPDFEIRSNEGLDVLTSTPDPLMRLMMLNFVLIVVPVFEEILFRGIVQSTIRRYSRSAWVAVFVTSALFAAMHPSHHWPAIFILSVGMGYSYERSGSLFRPIFMHVLFNTTNVVAAFLSK